MIYAIAGAAAACCCGVFCSSALWLARSRPGLASQWEAHRTYMNTLGAAIQDHSPKNGFSFEDDTCVICGLRVRLEVSFVVSTVNICLWSRHIKRWELQPGLESVANVAGLWVTCADFE